MEDTRSYMIGLTDDLDQGVWEWTRGVGDSNIPSTFHWAPDQPDGDSNENCAYLSVGEDYHLSGFWHDEDCNTAGYYAICEQYSLV